MEIRTPDSLGPLTRTRLTEYIQYLLQYKKPITLLTLQHECKFVGIDIYMELMRLNPELFDENEERTSKTGRKSNHKQPKKQNRKPNTGQ